ncbi:MAG: 30S ribosomal protein S4 [Alphaproteobacteria bacterium]|nr:MAG: 30S ribosomal protein S4 [Alphaproteobacteria bacterium]
MTRRIAAKHKIDRRLGVNLWGRDKSPFAKRNYGPGQHGTGRKKPSDYAVQLKAKQKLKGYYGNITEKQFNNLYKLSTRQKGDTMQNLIGLLESRIDAVVYRMKFAPTVFAARQLVNHGHVLVNGKRLDIPSARISEGDVVTLSPKLKETPVVLQGIGSKEREVPGYIEVDHKSMKGTFMKVPSFEEVPYPVMMEPHLVIEFYSR